MKKNPFSRLTPLLTAFTLFLSIGAAAQKTRPAVPAAGQLSAAIQVQIVKAEDERRWDKTLEDLLRNVSPAVRKRAALAAGRIGDAGSVPALAVLLEKDPDAQARRVAAFALGETESAKAADAILKTLANNEEADDVRARAVEAAGKIAAAEKTTAEKLGEAILDALEHEAQKAKQNKQLILLGLTAVLRARPEEGDFVTAKFLTNLDARVRADAANTLARLRAKNANETLHALLLSDDDATVRANAARALGAAEDKTAFNLLLEAAVSDEDPRVRVSAIRALGSLKDANAADKLLEHGNMLLENYKRSKFPTPSEKNELLEIATVLGRLLPNSNNAAAVNFLNNLDKTGGQASAEIKIALAQVSPRSFFENLDVFNKSKMEKFPGDWQVVSAVMQGLGELAKLEATDVNKDLRARGAAETAMWLAAYYKINSLTPADLQKPDIKEFIKEHQGVILNRDNTINKDIYLPAPDILRAYAVFKPQSLDDVLLNHLKLNDIFIRAAAAELLGEQPVAKENVDALKTAFSKAILTDKETNDAQLAILDALFKFDKKESVGILLIALNAPDYLVRKKAIELLKTPGLEKDFPGVPAMLENARAKKKAQVLPLAPAFGTKLGQILNTTADYTRAVSRKNGRVTAIVTTEKGAFTIDLLPEDAPLTVDNFIRLARAGYFNGVMVHRVVPNFVMQDGDPRGDGNGGPGWSIRCEVNMVPYERGAVGMALSGKDTGGSQWFVTHAPQPHLDGGYTVFGRVNEGDMKIVDRVARGDKILSVKIIEAK